MRAREEPDLADIVRGTFSIYDILVCTMIDPGSTHSYECITPPVDRGVQIDELKEDT